MTRTSLQKFLTRNETGVVVGIAIAIASVLFAFEAFTGLSASVRGMPIYGSLWLPSRSPVQTQLMRERMENRINNRRSQYGF